MRRLGVLIRSARHAVDAGYIVHPQYATRVVEREGQPAQVVVLALDGRYGNGHAERVFSEYGIWAVDGFLVAGHERVALVGEQVSSPRRDNSVNVGQTGYQRYVRFHVLQMAEQDYLVHAFGHHRVNLGLDGGQHIRVDDGGARIGYEGNVGSGDADEANALSAYVEYDARGYAPGVGESGEAGFGANVQVGAEERRTGLETLYEVREHVRAEVKLVVADGAGVVADYIHSQGVVDGRLSPVQAGPVLGAGERIVPCGYDKNAV